MWRITRRKRTDEGLLIPEWARRGSITLTQFSIAGPFSSTLQFRVDPEREGTVQVYFTGLSINVDDWTEIECHDFSLSKGFGELLRLEHRASIPFFDHANLGAHGLANRQRLVKHPKSLSFSSDFQSHEVRLLTFVWGLSGSDQARVGTLPVAWWLRWFEHCPGMTSPDLTGLQAVTSIGTRVHADTIRAALLEGNPDHPADDWLREIDLFDLKLEEIAEFVDRDLDGFDALDFEHPPMVELVAGPFTDRFTNPWKICALRDDLEKQRQTLTSRLSGLETFEKAVDDLSDRMEAVEKVLETPATVAKLDFADLILAVHCVSPASVGTCGVDGVIHWMRSGLVDTSGWFKERLPPSIEYRRPDPSEGPLFSRLLYQPEIDESSRIASSPALAPLVNKDPKDGSAFAPKALVWLLGSKPDVELRRLAELDDRGGDVIRLAHELAVIRSNNLNRNLDNDWAAINQKNDCQSFTNLLEVFPREIRDGFDESRSRRDCPTLHEMRDRFGVAFKSSTATMITQIAEVEAVFESRFRPLGFVPEDFDDSSLLQYCLVWNAWLKRGAASGTSTAASGEPDHQIEGEEA